MRISDWSSDVCSSDLDIVRIVTAGTLTEESLLDARSANWLAAACPAGGEIGLAWADISTGQFCVTSVAEATLEAELARIGAAELVSPEDWDGAPVDAARRGRGDFDSIRAGARLKQRFGVATQIGRASCGDRGGQGGWKLVGTE